MILKNAAGSKMPGSLANCESKEEKAKRMTGVVTGKGQSVQLHVTWVQFKGVYQQQSLAVTKSAMPL